MGSDCVKTVVAKLRTRNTTWDHDLYTLIQQQMEAIKPAHLSLMDLQQIVAEKIILFVTMKNSFGAAAPNAAIGKLTSESSQIQSVGVNADLAKHYRARISGL